MVLITLTSVRMARLKSFRSLRPHRSSQIKREARSSSTRVHPLASSGGTFFYLRVPFIAFHEVEKLLTGIVDGNVTTPRLYFRTVHESFQLTRLLVDMLVITPFYCRLSVLPA